ncbi:LysR family transcriptional regulator [Paraglaciecola polaris]|nr:LysR family transcriptional regulator [Paraglaciecola polaris]
MSRLSIGIPELSLRQLKAALYVADEKSVTRAAESLNRSQTAVTKALSDLEATLGVKLFDRTFAGMVPTVYGEALTNRVKQAEEEFCKAGVEYEKHKVGCRPFRAIPIFSMEISHKRLAAFVALFETHDINATASLLNITKAAVYNSIRQIEELLDLTLFEREAMGVIPTNFCTILARHVKLAFYQIRHAIEDIASLEGVTKGQVVIGTLPYTRTFLTPRAINSLLDKHPQLDVETVEGPYSGMETALRSGDVDFIVGAIRDDGDSPEIATIKLFEDQLAIIARKDHPLAHKKDLKMQDLQHAQWVLPSKQTPSRQLFEETLKRHGMEIPEHAVQTSSLSMVRGLLLGSDRIALLSEHQIHYDKMFDVLDVLPVQLENTFRPIGVTMRAHTQPSPAAKLFLMHLKQAALEISR